MPSSTFDEPNGRDYEWYEQIYPVLVQAAIDFQCVFVDVYGITKDSEFAAGGPYDNPYGDGRGIHPGDVQQCDIYGLICDAMFPKSMGEVEGFNRVVNRGGNEIVRTASEAPAFFGRAGLRIERAGAGFPFDGTVFTIPHIDNVFVQFNVPAASNTQGMGVRYGTVALGWGPWQYMNTFNGSFQPAYSAAITAYPPQLSVSRGTVANGFPFECLACTVYLDGGNGFQVLWAFGSDFPVAIRTALFSGWSNIRYQGGALSDVTPGAGFAIPANSERMRVTSEGCLSHISGYLEGPATTLLSGRVICNTTASNFFRSAAGTPIFKVVVWDGSNFEELRAGFDPNTGVISLSQPSTLSCTRIYCEQTFLNKNPV